MHRRRDHFEAEHCFDSKLLQAANEQSERNKEGSWREVLYSLLCAGPMAVWRRRGEQPAVPEWHHPTEEDERKLAALDAEAYEKVDELEAEPEGRWAQMQQRMLILIGTIGVLSTELL